MRTLRRANRSWCVLGVVLGLGACRDAAKPVATQDPAGQAGLTAPATGTLLPDNGMTWSSMNAGTAPDLDDVWGSGPTDVFAVGRSGTILHSNGTSWTPMTNGAIESLLGVWGSGPTDVFAVGAYATQVNAYGTILHYDGTSWSPVDIDPLPPPLADVWGSGSTDVFAVGAYGTVLHYNGVEWSTILSGAAADGPDLYDVWGSGPTDVFAVGAYGIILHYDGNSWVLMREWSLTDEALTGVWGSGPANVFAVGANGMILHFDGETWSPVDGGFSPPSLAGVWGSGSTDGFAVGADGTILHYDGTGWSTMGSGTTETLRSVWGSGSTDVFAVGGAQSATILHYGPLPAPSELLAIMRNRISALVTAGLLNVSKSQPLLNILANVEKQIDKGKFAAAADILEYNFIPKVQEDVVAGILSTVEGQTLIDLAQNAIDQLRAMT